MPESTTIKVSRRTRDALRLLAERDGVTLDAELDKLIRRERRRIIGAQLSGGSLDDGELVVLDASARDVADASR
jgi:DNA-binding transcriptional regulator WhiA